MNRLITFSLLVLFSISATFAQNKENESLETENTWKTLARLTYKKEFDELMGFKIDKPVFSDKVKALAGKEIIIKGYIIPVEGYKSHKEFILSAFPYNMCFFCGGAGPETVMEVEAKEPVSYQGDAIYLKGRLELNSDDINRLMYKIVDAEMIEEPE